MPGPIPTELLIPPQRTNYFTGRLLSVEDFQREQEYHIGSRRRLALALHGAGVVSGLKVRTSGPGSATVSAGLAIDPLGREIVVPENVSVPVTAKRGWILLAFAQEPIEPLLALPGDTDPSEIRFGVIRETYRLWFSERAPAKDDPEHPIVLRRIPARAAVSRKRARRK